MLLGSLLYGVPPRDLVTLAAVLVTLAVVGLLAGAIPARQAARVRRLRQASGQ